MSLTRTLLQLRTDLRNRADQTAGTYRADSVCNRYLSESCRSLVSRLTDEHHEFYWAKTGSVNTTPAAQTTALPADWWKSIHLRVTLNGSRKRVGLADLADLDTEASSLGGWGAGGRWPSHRIIGRALYWYPIPRAVHAVDLLYVPTGIFFNTGAAAISEMTSDTDYFDGVFGWETWVVLDAAIKLTNDEGGKRDQARLIAERTDRWEEIAAAAAYQHGVEAQRLPGNQSRDTYDPSRDDA